MPDIPDPSLSDVVEALIERRLGCLRTVVHATVVAYDSFAQRVTAQPTERGRFVDADGLLQADPEPHPPIPNLPVMWPSGAAWSLHADLEPGDPLVLVASDRSTDRWRTEGVQDGQVDVVPRDPRRFNLSDAFAFPGGRHFSAEVDGGPLPEEALGGPDLVIRAPRVLMPDSNASQGALLSGDFLDALDTFLDALQVAPDILAVNAAATNFKAALAPRPVSGTVLVGP